MGELKLHIEKTSPYTSIQADYRVGDLSLGVPPSGPIDPVSSRAANYLVGNPPFSPCIEMMLNGPSIKVTGNGMMATAGGNIIIKKNDVLINSGESFQVNDGDELEFSFVTSHRAAYLAIKGDWQLNEVFGSTSYLSTSDIGNTIIKGNTLVIKNGDTSVNLNREVPNFMKIETPENLDTEGITWPGGRYVFC